jgi:hypothetical protein
MQGAVLRQLAPLTTRDAKDLLSRLLDRERVAAQPAAVTALAQLCGNLPLALRIAAARLTERPHWPIELLVKRLRNEEERLSELQIADQSVRESFAGSFSELTDGASVRMFQLLGLLHRPDFTAASAAALANVSEPVAEQLLEELTSAYLIESRGPGRYRIPDLLRLFARECLREAASALAPSQLLPYPILEC